MLIYALKEIMNTLKVQYFFVWHLSALFEQECIVFFPNSQTKSHTNEEKLGHDALGSICGLAWILVIVFKKGQFNQISK